MCRPMKPRRAQETRCTNNCTPVSCCFKADFCELFGINAREYLVVQAACIHFCFVCGRILVSLVGIPVFHSPDHNLSHNYPSFRLQNSEVFLFAVKPAETG